MNKDSAQGVVYALKNFATDEVYIGSAINFKVRQRNHLSQLKRNVHHNPILQNSYNKYGLENFHWTILECCISSDILLEREQYYINTIKPHFNILPVAGTHLGRKRTKEVCEKISKSLMGKRLSDEHKEKVRKANIGKTHSIETKEKHRQRMIKKYSTEHNPVIQIDKKTNKVIKIFQNPYLATKELKIYKGGITAVLRGEKKTAGGFKWSKL